MNKAVKKALEICTDNKQDTAKILILYGFVNVREKKDAKNGIEVSISNLGKEALELLEKLPQ